MVKLKIKQIINDNIEKNSLSASVWINLLNDITSNNLKQTNELVIKWVSLFKFSVIPTDIRLNKYGIVLKESKINAVNFDVEKPYFPNIMSKINIMKKKHLEEKFIIKKMF